MNGKGQFVITFEQARMKAEELAQASLGGLVRSSPKRWLREEYLSEENCWLFLKATDIDFLPQCASSADTAFVISKKGKGMSVADHREDIGALKKYLSELSEYLARRKE